MSHCNRFPLQRGLFCALLLLWILPGSVSAQELPETVLPDTNSTDPFSIGGSADNSGIDLYKKNEEVKLIDITGKKDKESSFLMKPEFANRGKELEKKLNAKDNEIKEAYKSDRYLGDFKSNAKFVKILCRDHEFVDGDRVKVFVNDVVLQPEILLGAEFYGFTINLEKGFNKIDFQALNQGSSGPNTAEFRVYDDTGALVASNRWNLTTGVKATLIIVKE